MSENMSENIKGYRQTREKCNAGHILGPGNIAWKANGRKVCRACETNRKDARGKRRRRSTSTTAEAFVLLRKIAAHEGCSGSGWVEYQIRQRADALGLVASQEEIDEASGRGPEEPAPWDRQRALADAAFGGQRFSG